ncbi:hypothetical protein ACIBEJ_43605 [Nonomuraea sp. NPDC050790]|uniref:hypothetical protein n=1 Tax=Nonomuraea sp. NPDC050790 TaxID=3364371 RepID=UPI0037AB8353
MRPIPLLLAAAAATLAFAATGPAVAAPGVVFLHAPSGEQKTVENPAALKCHVGTGPGSLVRNATAGTILVFPDSACRTRIFNPVEPGEVRVDDVGSFMALD